MHAFSSAVMVMKGSPVSTKCILSLFTTCAFHSLRALGVGEDTPPLACPKCFLAPGQPIHESVASVEWQVEAI